MTTIYEHAGKKYRLADQRDIGKVINGSDIGFHKSMQNSVDTLVDYLPHKALGRYIGRDCRTGGEYEWKFAYVELTKEEIRALYTERQAAWVAENGVKPGTKVRVTRTAESYEDGWGDSWLTDMDKYVGKVLEVNRTDGGSIHLLTGDGMYAWNFPYFVLEVVKEPQWRLMGPEEIIDGECRYTNFEEDAEEPLDVFCGGWISLARCPEDHGKRVKDARTFSKLYATQRPLPAAKVEVPPPPEGYEVVPESEYASYVPVEGDYFLGGCSNSWLSLSNIGYTCAELRNQWPTSHQLYTGFARRIPVVAERPKVDRPEAPEGWHYIGDDEVFVKGDKYMCDDGDYTQNVLSALGSTIQQRKSRPGHWCSQWVGVVRKNAEKPDLWRLLGDDEIVQEGDWVTCTDGSWSVSDLKHDDLKGIAGWVPAQSSVGRQVSKLKTTLIAARRIGVESKRVATESERVLNSLCESIHAKNVKAGWWDAKDNPLVVPTKLALIHSEVSEALEGHRKGLKDDKLPEYDMVAVELADVLIRVFDLAGFLNIPLGTIIEAKERYNAQRADHKPENRKAVGGKRY